MKRKIRIGYAKIGRSWNLTYGDASSVGGDIDVIHTLQRLTAALPNAEFVLLGKNSGDFDYKNPRIINPWHKSLGLSRRIRTTVSIDMIQKDPAFNRSLGRLAQFNAFIDVFQKTVEALIESSGPIDVLILWLGQHGTFGIPIPEVTSNWASPEGTQPRVDFANYHGYLAHMINMLDVPVIYLCPDPRNYLKARDIMHEPPLPIIAQYEMERTGKHEQYNYDKPTHKTVTHKYIYAGLELTAIPTVPQLVRNKSSEDMGLIANENRGGGTWDRAKLIRECVLDKYPSTRIVGKWTDDGLKRLGRTEPITPIPPSRVDATLRSFRVTATFPASNSGWATAKAWEAFAVGVPCLAHAKYDEQGWIYRKDNTYLSWLVFNDSGELSDKLQYLLQNDKYYRGVVQAQHEELARRFDETRGGITEILKQIQELT